MLTFKTLDEAQQYGFNNGVLDDDIEQFTDGVFIEELDRVCAFCGQKWGHKECKQSNEFNLLIA